MEKNPFLQMLDKFQRLNKEQSELADLVQYSCRHTGMHGAGLSGRNAQPIADELLTLACV